MSSVDRRDLLGTMAAAGVGLAALKAGVVVAQGGKVRVVRCRRNNAIDDLDKVNADAVKQMVNQAVMKLVGAASPEAAWKKLFGPQDVVTVKVNCCFGPGACTHPEVTAAVVAGLVSAGVPEHAITVWDRSDGDLAKCGYEINKGDGVQCVGTGWEAQPTQNGSVSAKLATVLTKPQNTALVNVPVLKMHSMPGITLAMKNHYGSVQKPDALHGNRCDPFIADLNAVPAIRDKTRLIIVDALRPVGDGGPAANPGATWTYGAILAATDPVAMDTVGCKILDEWRATKGMAPIAPQAHYIRTAAQKGLGVDDPARIEVVDV